MVRSSKLSFPLARRRSSSKSSGRNSKESTRDNRRSASSKAITPFKPSSALEPPQLEPLELNRISLVITEPDSDNMDKSRRHDTFGFPMRGQQVLHSKPSSTILGEQIRRNQPLGNMDSFCSSPNDSTADMAEWMDKSNTSSRYYNPKKSPLSVSQQTSASSSRDLALRKAHLSATESQISGTVSPNPSVTSFQLPEGNLLSSSRFYRKRPPQLDLSLLFPTPTISSGGLLSPDKLVLSPVQISPTSDSSSLEGFEDDRLDRWKRLRKVLSKESVKSRDYPIDETPPPRLSTDFGNAELEFEQLRLLLKRKVSSDARSDVSAEDFVQKLAHNIHKQYPAAPKVPHQSENRQLHLPFQDYVQHKRSPGEGSTGRHPGSSQGLLSRDNSVARPRDERAVSRNSSKRITMSRSSSGSVFTRSDLQEQSVLALSSSEDEDEDEPFKDPSADADDGDTTHGFILQGRLETSSGQVRNSTTTGSSGSTYFITATGNQQNRGSQKSNLTSVPTLRTTRHCVSFVRAKSPERVPVGRTRSATTAIGVTQSWLTETSPPPSPPPSPRSLRDTALVIMGKKMMAVTQEEEALLEMMRKKRADMVQKISAPGGVKADDSSLATRSEYSEPTKSPKSSIWLPEELSRTQLREEEIPPVPSVSKNFLRLREPYIGGRTSSKRSIALPAREGKQTPYIRTNILPSPPSSEPSPITPPFIPPVSDDMMNCIISASTSPSSTVFDRKSGLRSNPLVINGIISGHTSPSSTVHEVGRRPRSSDRMVNRLVSPTTASPSSTQYDRSLRSKRIGGSSGKSDDEDPLSPESFAAQGFDLSTLLDNMNWRRS